jgi:hypothetical protein
MVEWDSEEGTVRNGTVNNGTVRNGTVRNGTVKNGKVMNWIVGLGLYLETDALISML